MKEHWLDTWEREKEEREEEAAQERVIVLRYFDATNNCWRFAQQWDGDKVEEAKSESRKMRDVRPDLNLKLSWMTQGAARGFRAASWD